jgi:gas vesicle protein
LREDDPVELEKRNRGRSSQTNANREPGSKTAILGLDRKRKEKGDTNDMAFKDDDSNLDAVLIALIAGVGIGFGLGILFAPRSGSRTRAALARSANDQIDRIKDRFDDLSDSASDLLDQGKRTISKHKDTLTQVAETAKKAYQGVVG